MQSPINKIFKHFDQFDQTPAAFTQLPATLKAIDSQAAVFQPSPSVTHLPRGLVPQLASASQNSVYCQPSHALAVLLAHRNNMLFSNNP